MAVYFLWGSIAIFVIALAIGFLGGFIRGLKRSSLHLLFFVVSLVVAYFITKPITNLILGISITLDGETFTISEYIVSMVNEMIDLSSYTNASALVEGLPMALIAPEFFVVLASACYFVFHLLYQLISRIAFGKKKKDFEKHKPHRWIGAVIGAVEGFMFIYILFAPMTSLTNIYSEIVTVEAAQNEETGGSKVISKAEEEETSSNELTKISDLILSYIPSEVNDIILAYNNSLLGSVCGAGGLNNALYDGLSNFEIDGETITLRTELVTLANTYDDFVDVYNAFVNEDYSSIDMTNLKANINKILDDGLFKAVITDTVQTYVVNFVAEEDTLGLPEVIQNVIVELQEVFKDENFDCYTYLKNDILSLVDIADEIISSEIISEYNKLEEPDLVDLLEFINTQNEDGAISSILSDVFSLNIVTDAFDSLGEFVSEALVDYFAEQNSTYASKNESEELVLSLNLTSLEIQEDKAELVEEIFAALEKLLDLNDSLSLSKLLDGGDFTSLFAGKTSAEIEDTLTLAGEALDTFRNISIFDNSTSNVFDNILALYDMEIIGTTYTTYGQIQIGGDVYVDGASVKVSSYTEFFDLLKTPLVNANAIGLLSYNSESVDFSTILDKILTQLAPTTSEEDGSTITDTTFLADTLMPLYNMEALGLGDMFDSVMSMIKSNVSVGETSMLDLADDMAYTQAKSALQEIGEVLNTLNTGEIEVEDEESKTTYTYIKYILSGDYDLDTLIDALRKTKQEGNISNDLCIVLDKVFASSVFRTFSLGIFQNIDSKIGEVTGIAPTTFSAVSELSFLDTATTRANTISAIDSLLTLIDSLYDEGKLVVATVGEILEVLKDNANSETSHGGVFNNVFVNLIWYMTGDDLSGVGTYTWEAGDTNEKTPYMDGTDETYTRIKNYLDAANVDDATSLKEGYYLIDYSTGFAGLADVIDFVVSLEGKGIDSSTEVTNTNVSSIASSFKSVVNGLLSSESEDDVVTIIKNTARLVKIEIDSTYYSNMSSVLETDGTEDSEEGLSSTIITAIQGLFTVTTETNE